MGVPGFYRWAVRRVPQLKQRCQAPYEFDCVHLDFNGVIHGCVEAWGGASEEALFRLIEAEIALILGVARPTLLLHIAIDGVAPRAKMNQQRSRRFRAAKATEEAAETLEGVCAFDRNAITPGTDFMERLSHRLQAWAEDSARSPFLRGVTVVISDDRDPGEGEQKIMEVIRRHPERTHCLVSSDADLVFLGLVSPAQHVYLLRAKQRRGGSGATPSGAGGEVPGAADYELLSIVAVRRYLSSQFPGCDEGRLRRDFVAMCCLAGNDFLPHLPAVDIYEGGIDRLMSAYRAVSVEGGLVSEEGSLSLPHWRDFLGHFLPAEVEALFEQAGLGLGSKMPPWRGPAPPGETWDGLSVLVAWAPAQASAADIVAAMSKQGCVASCAHALLPRNNQRGTSSWLVRFADAASALKTLTSVRRVWGNKVGVSWADPSACEFKDPPEARFEGADWRPQLEAMVRECFEFWLGPANLPGDAFLRRHIRQRKDRYVLVRVLAKFPRMQTLLQDLDEVCRILRSSEKLEVQGGGAEAMVRGLEDHSVRPEESEEQIARQQEAAEAAAAGDFVVAALALKGGYYSLKTGPSGSPDAGPAEVERHRGRAFLEGIEWVARYYLRGCSSWSWFFPAHYPPLCVSLMEVTDTPLVAPPLQAPFPPELQLMAVLPPQSARLLPEHLRHLLQDAASPIADFYPRTFEVDRKDGDLEWQGIVLLPFVDEARLRAALQAASGMAHGQGPFCAPRAFHAPVLSADGDEGTGVKAWDFDAPGALPAGRPSATSTHQRPEEVPSEEQSGRVGRR